MVVSNLTVGYTLEWLARRLDVLQKDWKMVAKFDLQSTEETYTDTDDKPFNHFNVQCEI